MADILKVFKNVNVTLAAGRTATTIPIHTTGATESIVLKDIQLEIEGLDVTDAGFYKYTTTLEVNGVKQAPAVNLAGTYVGSTPLLMTGSQIVGPNSAVTLEIIAESELTNYGKAQCMWVERDASSPTFGNFTLGSTSPANFDTSTLFNNLLDTGKTVAGATTNTGYSGGVITSGLPPVTKYFYSDGSYVYIFDDTGALLKRWQPISDTDQQPTCYGCAADDTYIYAKSSSSSASYKWLLRFNHVTMLEATQLTTTANYAYGQSNKGWIGAHGGNFYYRTAGSSSSNTYQVDTTTGTVTTMTYPGTLDHSEFVGGVINTNIHGQTFLVIHGDSHMQLINQEDGTNSSQAHGFSSEPTTTNSNHVISIAPGIVWINNGSYNENKIVDFNNIESGASNYTQTHTESVINIGTTTQVFIGGKHQGVSPKERTMSYRLLASGIQST